MEHWNFELTVEIGSIVSLSWLCRLNSEEYRVTFQISTVLEILCETLVKTWNDYVREYNLPFRSIDVADVKGITQDMGSSDFGESPKHDFEESPPSGYPIPGCPVNRREIPIEQVDEQLFFDYFQKHVNSPCRGIDGNRDQDPSCEQENLAVPVELAGECKDCNASGLVNIPQKSENNATSGDEVYEGDLRNFADDLNLREKMASLDVNLGKQKAGIETSEHQQGIQSPDLKFVEKLKESENTDMKWGHEPQSKENEMSLKLQNNVSEDDDNKSHRDPEKNTSKFSELHPIKSDKSAPLENVTTEEIYNSDITTSAESKTTAAESSEFHSIHHPLESVSYKDDLFNNLIKHEKERINTEIDNITKECLKIIFSKILKNSDLLTFWSEASRTRNESDALAQPSNAELFPNVVIASGVNVSNRIRIPSIETAFNDFVRNRAAAEEHAQESDYFPNSNEPKESSGNPNASDYRLSSNCTIKDECVIEKDEVENFTNGDFLINLSSPNDSAVTGRNCLENESSQLAKGEFEKNIQDPGVENKPLTNAEVAFTELREFDPLSEQFTVRSSPEIAFSTADTTGEISNWINLSKEMIQTFSVVPGKKFNELSEDEIALVEQLRQKLIEENNRKEQEMVRNEASDTRKEATQSIEFPASRSISTRDPCVVLDAEKECVKFGNLDCEKQELTRNDASSSYKLDKCEYSLTSSCTTVDNTVVKGIGETKHESKGRNFNKKIQPFGKTKKGKHSGVSTVPSDATAEEKFEKSRVQDADTVGCKWISKSVIFGKCPECEDDHSQGGDSEYRISRKDVDRQVHYKDRRCRSKPKKRKEAKGKPSNLSKKADICLKKRVTFLEENCIFSYDPKETILETFSRAATAGKLLERTSRSRERSTGRSSEETRSSLMKNISKPPKKNTTAVGKQSLSPPKLKRNIFQNFNKSLIDQKETKWQIGVKEQRNPKTVDPYDGTVESDLANVFLNANGAEGFVNPAFEDVPAFDCIPDFEGRNSTTISATFEEDVNLLSGEETLAADQSNDNLTEMGRHAEGSVKRWVRLSFKKMMSALRKTT